jgi:hypothetical protein
MESDTLIYENAAFGVAEAARNFADCVNALAIAPSLVLLKNGVPRG